MISPCLRNRTYKTEDKGEATDALGAMVAAVPGEMGRSMGYSLRPYKTYSKSHLMSGVYNKMSRPMRLAGANDGKGEATDVLGAMVAAVPEVRAAVWVL